MADIKVSKGAKLVKSKFGNIREEPIKGGEGMFYDTPFG